MTRTRPHLAAVVEDSWNHLLVGVLERRGWQQVVLPLTGYGGADFVRVLARVVLEADPAGVDDALLAARRGWRSFVTAEVGGAPVTICIGDDQHHLRTDRTGMLDARLPNPGLAPGWHEVEIHTETSEPAFARVRVVAPDESLGLISDIDDTVITTWLPRPLVAAFNTFVQTERRRKAVAGMAELYARILQDHPGAPTVYVSTGAWNTAATLRRFLRTHGYPDGPLLLTDWGPTNTGWFRSGAEHKRACLEQLARDFPAIRWVLVGDDGQRDPVTYGDFARRHPDRVRAIAIRQLGAEEQVLAHGTPTTRPEAETPPSRVPEVRAPDGYALVGRLLPVIDS